MTKISLLRVFRSVKRPAAVRIAICELVICVTFLFFLFAVNTTQAQCNTTLNKLLPDASVNNDDRFGSAMAANGQYMVVAAESSDTTGVYFGGAAYVYEKTVAGWAYRAMLTASDPEEYDFFGNQVAIDASGSTIVVINRSYDKGGAYIFEKPASGWETTHETFNIKFPEYLEFNSALDISDDGATIVVSNPMSPHGMLYLLRKPVSGWSNAMTPEVLAARINKSSSIWLGSDVLIQDNYIYASTNNEGNPAIYVYKLNGTVYSLIAKLSASIRAGLLAHFGEHLTVHGDMIAATGGSSDVNFGSQPFFLFKKNGEWADMNETVHFQLPFLSQKFPFPIQFTSSTKMIAGVLIDDGEYYTGKVIELTTGDGSWQDFSMDTIFEDHKISRPTEFANEVIWNGSDLVMATARKNFGYAYRNSILSLTKSGGLWGSLQQVVLQRNSSSNVNFGTSIVKTKDAMFAGAPYDGTVGRGAGAVYVYNRAGVDFVKVHTIYPSPRKVRPAGGSDAGFGYSLAVHGDEMAVGATSFLYATNNNKYGKIFMYRRTSSDWTSVELYDSLIVPENLNLNHVGATIAMNDHVLFASAYNNFNDEHTNAVVVFEKINNKWSYKQLIKLGKPLDKEWPSVTLSLNNDLLAIGESITINGGVSIFSRNSDSGTWEVSASISGAVFSGLGGAVKLQDNHLFVGSHGYNYNNIYKSGAVVVFTKLPGESWRSNMEPSAIIGAKDPIEGAFFGSSLDVIGNTLVVGAPGMFLTFDSNVRTIPGNSYVIQSQDYYWKNTTQYINLAGDRFASNERDHFGSKVILDEEYFYIGARSEHTATGRFSGAVYYIPTPPVIFLQPPVCKNADPFVLKAYPPNGSWTGTGVDAQGTFDPASAGIGIFTLTYSTPNCNYQGTVQIEVKAPITVQQLSPAEVVICSEENTTLRLESINHASYDWYYKQEGGNSFVWLAKGDATFVATNPGEYKAIISYECSAESPVFRVRIEDFTISMGPQPVVCSPAGSVSLIASDNTGVWEGVGVSNNQFNPAGLSNGIYKLTYRITTSAGCHVSLKDSIKINAVGPLTIAQSDNDFCETGFAKLQATPKTNDVTYTWYYKATQGESLLPVNQVLSSEAIVYKQGYYQVSATNGECSNISNIQEVGFVNNLAYTLFPAENIEQQVCNADDFTIDVRAREGTVYTWQFKPDVGDAYSIVNGETSDRLIVTENGFYSVKGEYGFCSFESSPVSVQFLRDVIFVPNIFTPNGDEQNPVFKVETTSTISSLSIFNRYGDKIHSNSSGVWDGGAAPSGVYFWYLRYDGCDQQPKELKGWVQLLR